MNRDRVFAHAGLVVLVLLAASGAARADWPASDPWVFTGFINTSLQHASIVRGPTGDLYVTARKGPTGFGVRAQRISADGLALWAPGGAGLNGSLAQQVFLPASVPTTDGGLLHAGVQYDYWGSAGHYNVLALVHPDGTQPAYDPPYYEWPLSSAVPGADADAAPDGFGGAFVAWFESYYTPEDQPNEIYLQRRLGDGSVAPGWPERGMKLVPDAFATLGPSVASDGAGGCLVMWIDVSGVHVNRVMADTSRAPGWPASGLLLRAGSSASYSTIYRLIPSGADHFIAVWLEGADVRMVAQRFHLNGTRDPAWPAAGVVVLPGQSDNRGFTLLSDGQEGVHVLWEKAGLPRWTRLSPTGAYAPGHTSAGVSPLDAGAVYSRDLQPYPEELVAMQGANGGLVFLWSDHRAAYTSRARWLLGNGTPDPARPDTGLALPFGVVAALADGANGGWAVYTAWDQGSFLTGLKMARVLSPGSVAVEPAPALRTRLALSAPAPQPARGSVSLRFTLASDAPATLALYDVSGRAVRSQPLQGAGAHVVTLDRLDGLPAGVYLAALEQRGARATTRVVLVH